MFDNARSGLSLYFETHARVALSLCVFVFCGCGCAYWCRCVRVGVVASSRVFPPRLPDSFPLRLLPPTAFLVRNLHMCPPPPLPLSPLPTPTSCSVTPTSSFPFSSAPPSPLLSPPLPPSPSPHLLLPSSSSFPPPPPPLHPHLHPPHPLFLPYPLFVSGGHRWGAVACATLSFPISTSLVMRPRQNYASSSSRPRTA